MDNTISLNSYLLRRAKLYHSASQPPQRRDTQSHQQQQQSQQPPQSQHQQYQQFMVTLLGTPTGYRHLLKYLNHYHGMIHHCIGIILEAMLTVIGAHSGKLYAYMLYRMAKQCPAIIMTVVRYLRGYLTQPSRNIELVIFVTDIFLYGFPLSSDDFLTLILPLYLPYTLNLKTYYSPMFSQPSLMVLQIQHRIKSTFDSSIINHSNTARQLCHQLLHKGHQIQQLLLLLSQSQSSSPLQGMIQQYVTSFERYQLMRDKLRLVGVGSEVEGQPKDIIILKKQCEHYKPSYRPLGDQLDLYYAFKQTSQHQHQHHHQHQHQHQHRHQHQHPPQQHHKSVSTIEQDQIFVDKLLHCDTLIKTKHIINYFFEILNCEPNRQQLLDIILSHYGNNVNLPYMVYVLAAVTAEYPSLKGYLNTKARKLTNHHKMNSKYMNTLCELAKYELIEVSILLNYLQYLISTQSYQSIKQSLQMLNKLGPIVYHHSLQTNIKINQFFVKVHHLLKKKMNSFDLNVFLELKSIEAHLKISSDDVKRIDIYDEMHEISIESNFGFILRSCEKLVDSDQHQRVWSYLVKEIGFNQYTTTYLFASLLSDLNDCTLNQMMTETTANKVREALSIEQDLQSAVKWSRFLGELYNYQIVTRKKLVNMLTEILEERCQDSATNFDGLLKCILAALETSKAYLYESQASKQSKLVLEFLLRLKIKVIQKRLKNTIIEDEFCDLLQYFHRNLLLCLNTKGEIQQILAQKDGNLHTRLQKLSNQNSSELSTQGEVAMDQQPQSGKVKYKEKTEQKEHSPELSDIMKGFEQCEQMKVNSHSVNVNKSTKGLMKIIGKTKDGKKTSATVTLKKQ